MSVFVQIVILLIVLSSMVMVLLAIRQLTKFEDSDHTEEVKELKDELEESGNIMSRNNIFHSLVEIPGEDTSENKDYKSKTKDPLSRRE